VSSLSSIAAVTASLERITITRNHFMVSCDRVNPLYFNEIEQIHTFRRNREAILPEGDLL